MDCSYSLGSIDVGILPYILNVEPSDLLNLVSECADFKSISIEEPSAKEEKQDRPHHPLGSGVGLQSSLSCLPSTPLPRPAPYFKTPTVPQATDNFAVQTNGQFKVPLTPVPRCKSKNWSSSMDKTSCGHLVIPLTPHLMNLCSQSPSLGTLSMDMLSTPCLFPADIDTNVPDLLHLIDSDKFTPLSVSDSMASFDSRQADDSNIAELVAEMEDDYARCATTTRGRRKCHRGRMFAHPLVTTTVIKSASPQRKARHSKCLAEELRIALRDQQKRRKKEKSSKGNDMDISSAQSLQARVKRSGRRSRSSVKVCQELGLATTEQELNAFFS